MTMYFKLEKALKKPKKAEGLSVSLDEDDLSLLDQLDTLVNLKKISLMFGKGLTEFPASILKLTKLESLTIIDTGIKEIPADISKLKNLIEIIIKDCPINELPDSFVSFPKLESLELWRLPLIKLPENLGEYKSLEKAMFVLEELRELPESIGDLKNLKSLFVRDSKLNKFPESILRLSKLRNLSCFFGNMKVLPDNIGELKELRILHLPENQLERIPESIGDCINLVYLELNDNKIKTIPESIVNLSKLEDLFLLNNPLERFPYPLLEWRNKIGKNKRDRFQINPTLYKDKPIFNLLDKVAFKVLSYEDKIRYFHVFMENEKEVKEIDHLLIRNMLNSKVKIVADGALDVLINDSAKSIKAGSQVLILGKTSRTKTELLNQMETLGLSCAKKYDDTVTHILVSSRANKKLDTLPQNVSWNWISEAQLINYMDKMQPSFLQEENADESIEQVINLIMTLDENNMALALELISGGGIAPELITVVYIVYKFSKNEETRKKAQKLLKDKASVGLKKALRNRKRLRLEKEFWDYRDRLNLIRRVEEVCDDSGIDLGVLTYVMVNESSIAYSYAMQHCPRELKLKLIRKIIAENEGVFKHNHFDYLQEFPIELCEITSLKHIQMYVNYGEWNFHPKIFKKNTNFQIPEEISNLQSLETLAVEHYVHEKLPIKAFAKLRNLKKLRLVVSLDYDTQELEKALPNCELKIVRKRKAP